MLCTGSWPQGEEAAEPREVNDPRYRGPCSGFEQMLFLVKVLLDPIVVAGPF